MIILPEVHEAERRHARNMKQVPMGELSAYEVLQRNLEFYYQKAESMLQKVRELTAGDLDENPGKRLAAMEAFLGTIYFRDKATEVANCLIRFQMRPMAPKPYRSEEEGRANGDAAKLITVIPRNEKIREAFRRAAAGLPPMPRKIV